MWRWPVVASKKAANNQQKQKIFSLHSKLIALAAQKGGDPDMNPSLYDAIEKAKKDNVPNENITRAIKKGTWEDASGTQVQKIIYEGYGAWGVAFMIGVLSDNKNRTVASIRHIFSKYGGNLWEPGSVGFIFQSKWILIISLEKYNHEDLENMVFETQAQDFFVEDNYFKILTSLEDFWEVRKYFLGQNIELEYAKIDYIPDTLIDIADFDTALKLTKMIDEFHDDEDVETISANLNINHELQKEVDEFIEKNTFHT